MEVQKHGEKHKKGQVKHDKIYWHRGKPAKLKKGLFFCHIGRTRRKDGAFGKSKYQD